MFFQLKMIGYLTFVEIICRIFEKNIFLRIIPEIEDDKKRF